MNDIVNSRDQSQQLFLDNGSEFISKVLDQWAYEHHVALAFSRPGKPTNNASIEHLTAVSGMNA